MFINGQRYKQSSIPTPTGYLVTPQNRDHIFTSSSTETTFVVDGWYNKQDLPMTESRSDSVFKKALIDAVKQSDAYVWAGDNSAVGIEYLAPFSEVKETENQYVEVNEHTTYYSELGLWVNFHWNRLALMKAENGDIYVFPHSLVYWVSLGFCKVSKCLRNVIVRGEHVSDYELDEHYCFLDEDLSDLKSVWDEAEDNESSAPKISRKPFNTDLPVQYQGDYPKAYVEAESWINFGSEHHSGEYKAQTFYVPSPVDEQTLKTLLGRQHDNHVALAYIMRGFRQIAAICSESAEFNKDLFVLFLNRRKYQKFAAYVKEREGLYDSDLQEHTINFRDKLRELAPSLFPFTHEG